MSFFSRVLNFFSPPKQDTSMAAVRAALKSSRARDGSGRYVADDPLTKEDEAWLQGHPSPYKKKNHE
jgi:hypothetical protein